MATSIAASGAPSGSSGTAGSPYLSELLAPRSQDVGEATLAAVLDSFAVSLCVVDAGRTVRTMNAAARKLVHETACLVVRERRLCACDAQGTLQLAAAIEKVCRRQLERDALQLGCRPSTVQVQIQVRAIAQLQGPRDAGETLALVVFGQPRTRTHDPWTLRRLFGLSHAEACLLVELLEGKRLDECAASRGIKLGTARTQLKAIFMKTGTASQGQLIAIAKTLPATAESGP